MEESSAKEKQLNVFGDDLLFCDAKVLKLVNKVFNGNRGGTYGF